MVSTLCKLEDGVFTFCARWKRNAIKTQSPPCVGEVAPVFASKSRGRKIDEKESSAFPKSRIMPLNIVVQAFPCLRKASCLLCACYYSHKAWFVTSLSMWISGSGFKEIRLVWILVHGFNSAGNWAMWIQPQQSLSWAEDIPKSSSVDSSPFYNLMNCDQECGHLFVCCSAGHWFSGA